MPKLLFLLSIFFARLFAFFGDTVSPLYHHKGGSSFEGVAALQEWESVGSGFAFGYSFDEHWFKFEVENKKESDSAFYIEFSEPFAHICDFYLLRQNGEVESYANGLHTPLEKRSIAVPLPTVKTHLKAGEKLLVFVNYRSRFTSFGAFRVYDEVAYASSWQKYLSFFMLYFGAALSMIIYNLFLFASLKDKAYGYYVAHGFVFAVWVFLYSGYSLYFISSQMHYVLHFTTPFAYIFFGLYSLTILQTKECCKKLYKIALMLIFMLLPASIFVALDTQRGYLLANALGTLYFPFFLFLAFYSFKKGVKTAKFYLAAIVLYLTGMTIVSNLALGLVEYSTFAKLSFVVGSLVELMLFSLLLAYHIHLLRASQIETQQRLIALTNSRAGELSKMVEERTAELKNALEERTLLLKEVHHRVKNNLQSITALLWMQGRKSTSNRAKEILNESANKIKSIATIHELLYSSPNLNSIELKSYIPKIVESASSLAGEDIPTIELLIDDVRLDMDRASYLGMIVSELFSNSLKHAKPALDRLKIDILIKKEDGFILLSMGDNGAFFKTKNDTNGANLGLAIVEQMSVKLGATRSELLFDNGMRYTLEFRDDSQK